ncbi:MAG: hypothetical protein LBH19_03365 [Dysgonamonadaceae bacterium]|nr:hypothetical protein [Dysgonamonadaceae bacterium]
MRKKSEFLFYWLCAVTLIFVSCSKEEEGNDENLLPAGKGIFVLNQGAETKNEAALSFYSTETGTLYSDIQNGKLGDVGQSLFIFRDKLFIAVSSSARIRVLDLYSKKTLADIPLEEINGAVSKPRYFATDGTKIYVSALNGYVLRINPDTYTVEGHVQVGPNPEGIAVVNGKIYVANSDGMNYSNNYENGNSVSVINTASFTKDGDDIAVATNPTVLHADKYGNVYVVSNGDYAGNPVLQKINTQTRAVEVLPGISVSNFTIHENTCYLYSIIYDANWNPTASVEYFDITASNPVTQKFIMDGTVVTTPYAIAVEPVDGKIYIADAIDYVNPGKVYVFNASGGKNKSFNAGIMPCDFAFYY